MSYPRFFHSSLTPTLRLKETEFHHLRHVMRIEEGEKIELCNGKGDLALATVEKIERSEAVIQIEQIEHTPPSSPTVRLALAFPKFSNLEWILEKGTEIGIDEWIVFQSERSEKSHLTETQKNRVENLLISAIKQCKRLYLPQVIIKPDLSALLEMNLPLYFAHLDEKKKKISQIDFQKEPETLLVIGPEKGWGKQDLTFFSQYAAGAVTLGPYILRAETASIVASSCLIQELTAPRTAH